MNWSALGKVVQAVLLVAIIAVFQFGWRTSSTEHLLDLVAILTIVSVLPTLAGDLQVMKARKPNRWIAASLALSVSSVMLLMVGVVLGALHGRATELVLFGSVVTLVGSALARHVGFPRIRPM
jgi:predicted neutral ceramidase superfamily lipid hydrolase